MDKETKSPKWAVEREVNEQENEPKVLKIPCSSCHKFLSYSKGDYIFLLFLKDYRKQLRGTQIIPSDYLLFCEDCLKRIYKNEYMSPKELREYMDEEYLSDWRIAFHDWVGQRILV